MGRMRGRTAWIGGRAAAWLSALALLAAWAGAASAGEEEPYAGLSARVAARHGAGGCEYRLLGFALRDRFLYARFRNGCAEPAVFNLCLRDRSGRESNRATPAQANRPAEIGLGHVDTIPDQRVRWTVDEPACAKPAEGDPAGGGDLSG